MTAIKKLTAFAKWFMGSDNKEIIVAVFVTTFADILLLISVWLSNLILALIGIIIYTLFCIAFVTLYIVKKNEVIELKKKKAN